ncbi:ubiquitin-protein ligase molybdopterin-converting factor [Phycomyces blakesleeanus]|uniref:Ubiquitin-protein ligase molybdopterin-converting factor n=1 Tax=Phycomyces blakesleeanus TaxID=4837 RepID=A0ABR3ANI5_PHYBL
MSSVDRLVETVSRVFNTNDKVARLTLTAVAASMLTASTLLSYQTLQRRRRTRELKAELRSMTQTTTYNAPFSAKVDPITAKLSPEARIEQQLVRNADFLGTKGLRKVRDSFVIVVGAGGVGSWAALMLARSGVQRIRIIDFDQVTLSSLNRHAVATLEDVGTSKVSAIRKHFEAIAPFIKLETRVELLSADNVDDLLSGNPDYVVDAIDNIETKIELIQYCHEKKINVVSSMGSGAKANPSLIQIADISETFEDPLARTVRRKLKKVGIEHGVPVAYSTEKPHHVKLLPLEEDRVQEADDFAALPDFRSRILPVLGTLPSMFGMSIATYIILKLAEFPSFEPLSIKLRNGMYSRVHRDLMMNEMKYYDNKVCPLDVHDVSYVFEEMWHGKSILSGPSDRVALARWDRSKPLSYDNTVCLTKVERTAHQALPADTDLCKHYGKDVYDRVCSKFAQERRLQDLWDDVL